MKSRGLNTTLKPILAGFSRNNENQMDKTMENEMEACLCKGLVIGIVMQGPTYLATPY